MQLHGGKVMSTSFQDAKLTGLAALLTKPVSGLDQLKEIYEGNRHRVYALAFWMTDNELTAESVMQNTFLKAFSVGADDPESIDRILLSELLGIVVLGPPSLECENSYEIVAARQNTLRVHLERAVVQLPATERLIFLLHDVEGYRHERICRLLGINEPQSQHALHQARLRIRELLAQM